MLSKHFVDLIVQPKQVHVESALSAVPDEGSFSLLINGVETAAIPFGADKAAVRNAIRAVVGPNVAFSVVAVPADQALELDFFDYAVVVAVEDNTLEASNVPVTFDEDPLLHSYDFTMDLGGFRDIYLEITYAAGTGGDLTLWVGGTVETLVELEDLAETLDADAGTLGLEIKNIYPRMFRLGEAGLVNVLNDRFPVIRLQGLKLGV